MTDKTKLPDEEVLLDTHEAAAYLRLSYGTLVSYRSTLRRGPAYVRVGPKLIRYRLSDLKAFIRDGNLRFPVEVE